MERDRGEIAGDEPQQVEVEVAGRFASLALGEFVRGCGEHGERRAVHHRGSEAAHQPRARAVIGQVDQIEDVLDNRKTGADGEPGNDRVELVADAVHAEEHDHDRPP